MLSRGCFIFYLHKEGEFAGRGVARENMRMKGRKIVTAEHSFVHRIKIFI